MVGASGASIHRWEQGKSHPRQAQVGRLVAVRKLGKREVVKRLVSREVTDTQCGLKAFSQRAAHEIFSRLNLDGFSFDAEVVFLTQRLGLKFQRIPVNLVREYGSTLSLWRHTLPMLRDIVELWWRNRHLQELPLQLPTPAGGYPEPAAAPDRHKAA